jgi:hypothetical protein
MCKNVDVYSNKLVEDYSIRFPVQPKKEVFTMYGSMHCLSSLINREGNSQMEIT